MTTICDDLRKAVLQAAIQGRLTQQLPEDGNAEDLYQEIQKEKQKLIKEGKIKKEKPLPEITEEDIPFDIPENWVWVRLGAIGSLIRGSGIKKDETTKDGKPCVRYGEIYTSYWLQFDKAKTCTSEDVFSKCKQIKYGDLIFTLTGENKPDIAKTIAYLGNDNVAVGGDLAIWSNHCCNPKYLSYFMYSDYAIGQKVEVATGDIIVHVSCDKVGKFLLPLPPLAEQKRIVARVDELRARINEMEKTEKDITALYDAFPGDMKASLLQAAIQGKLTEQMVSDGDAETLYQDIQKEKHRLIKEGKIKKEKPLPEITEDDITFDIPENWKWVRWGDLSFSIQYGYNAPALQKGRIRMVRISDIQNNAVAWNTVPYCNINEKDIPDYLLETNDILFARTGGTVGKSYLVKEVPYKSIYAGYLIRTRYSSNLVSSYMKYFMESQLYWNQLKEGTTATAQPNCNGQTLSKLLIPLPPLAEQKRIVEKLDQLLPLCDAMRANISGGGCS